MDLQEIKKLIEESEFPKETAEAVENILGMVQARNGELTEPEVKEILNLIDDAIIKNDQETKLLLDLVEAVQDIQVEILDAADKAKELELDVDDNNDQVADQTGETPPANSAPATTPTV